jgi:hypothetical protein
LRRGNFAPRDLIQSPTSRVIGKARTSPLMNTDDTDQEIGDRKDKTLPRINTDERGSGIKVESPEQAQVNR